MSFPLNFTMLRLYIRSGKLLGMYLEWTLIQLLKPEGDWACLCVQVDVDKPFINTVLIGRFEQAVTYEGIHRMCFSCGRMGHRRESCPYTIRAGKDQVDKDEGDSVDRAGQPCNSHASDSPERAKGTTPEALEDNYGPWLLVSRKKAGTKGRGGDVADAGRVHTQGQKGCDAHALATKAGMGSAPNLGSRYSLREGKRKLSFPKPPMAYFRKEGNHAGVVENPISAQGPSHSGPLDKFHSGLEEGLANSKLASSASIKGKKVIA